MYPAKIYQVAEKFINDEFWKNTHDPHSKLNIPKIIEEQLVKENCEKDPDYYNHREGVVHSTSLSKCLRGVVYEMLGAEKSSTIDTRKLGIFKAGNLFEDFVIDALGDRVVHRQREYEYHHKNIILVGRSDYTIDDEGVLRVGENKSVHSDSFWMREREGTLIAWQNQIQLETYLWLERILTPYKDEKGNIILTNVPRVGLIPAPEEKLSNPQGVFSYISKDDCTVIGAPVQFNMSFVTEIIEPILELINEAYTRKDPLLCPLPEMVIFSEAKHQYQKNWLASYCEYHSSCVGAGWLLEATNLVTQKNKELKASFATTVKKVKPEITVVQE